MTMSSRRTGAKLLNSLQTNNYPDSTGRVSPAPGEGACTPSISSPAVTIKSIGYAIIDYGFMAELDTPNQAPT
ncbi:unnamed protein product, partial [Mesorhabditis spiculigera]